ncbi:nicotinamide N-methyltransferase-like isoform X2 [Bufo bufo]|uniref:nicotinamide N-methyltransferase-like isoform X2 n=1 Tax=Bufo bufo TaxID=8384 RepID=UPI001ABEB15D|nr:nicotinamide N-methyltransferase-like isoform X2 [Bufo bufo]
MDSSTYKLYHKDCFDSREHLDTYFSDKDDMVFGEDFLLFPIEHLRKTFALGHIKGDILIDFSIGPVAHHLYSSCDFFKNIIVLKVSDRCIMELKRWADARTGAFDWNHAAKLHVDTEGNSDELQEMNEKVKSAIHHVLKCDLEKPNITGLIVLPPADCIISAWLLDAVCKEQEDYIRGLSKLSGLLKPGGHLILIGVVDATFFTNKKDRFHAFNYNERFAREAVEGAGFVIDCCKVKERTAVSDLTDYKGTIFIVAHKEQ